MRILTLILSTFLLALPVFGETLSHVEVLEIKTIPDGEELKLKDLKLTPDGHFFVILDKKDKDALSKSALVIKKLLLKDKYKLTLEIDSFSPAPAGSSYKSPYVEFKGKE